MNVDFDLFSINFLLVICAITVALTTYLLVGFARHWFYKRLPFVLIGTALLTALLQFLVGSLTQSAVDLPNDFWMMLLPFSISFCLAAAVVVEPWFSKTPKARKRKKRPAKQMIIIRFTVAGGLALCSIIFVLALANNYYKFYPTFYSIFGDDQSLLNTGGNQVDLQYAKTSGRHQQSIERSLTHLSKQTAGRVFSVQIPGNVSGFQSRTAWVYEPAIARSNVKISLPVLVLLGGVPGSVTEWLVGGGVRQTLDNFAKSHDGITPMVFMVDDTGSVDNDTECVDSPRGNIETYLTDDVPNYIRTHYNVLASPNNWAIGGLSMGGTCGITLAIRHPGIYHYFLDFGGDIGPSIGSESQTIALLFGGSKSAWAAHQPKLLLQAKSARGLYAGMGGFFTVGHGDALATRAAVEQLYRLSGHDGMDVAYETLNGEHTFSVWSQSFKDSLPWLSNRLGATECDVSCY